MLDGKIIRTNQEKLKFWQKRIFKMLNLIRVGVEKIQHNNDVEADSCLDTFGMLNNISLSCE